MLSKQVRIEETGEPGNTIHVETHSTGKQKRVAKLRTLGEKHYAKVIQLIYKMLEDNTAYTTIIDMLVKIKREVKALEQKVCMEADKIGLEDKHTHYVTKDILKDVKALKRIKNENKYEIEKITLQLKLYKLCESIDKEIEELRRNS